MLRSPWSISGRQHGFSSRCILPLSIRLISRTSLIRLSRWFPDVIIFFRYSFTWSFWSMWVVASAVNPTMAFMGVRISWDILDRNVLLALFARFACKRASSSRFFCSISLRISSSTLWNPRTTPWFFSHDPARTTFNWKYLILPSFFMR